MANTGIMLNDLYSGNLNDQYGRIGVIMKNARVLAPDDDLAAEYAWMKSSDRDTEMGALSYTNRRTLILTPGVYSLTTSLTLDTNYVDIVAMSGNPFDTRVEGPGAGGDNDNKWLVKQTAETVRLQGFTLKNTTTDAYASCLLIANEKRGSAATSSVTGVHLQLTKASSNLGQNVIGRENRGKLADAFYIWGSGKTGGWYQVASVTDDDTVVLYEAAGYGAVSGAVYYSAVSMSSDYLDMRFEVPAGHDAIQLSVVGYGHLGGYWKNCYADTYGWRVMNSTGVTGTQVSVECKDATNITLESTNVCRIPFDADPYHGIADHDVLGVYGAGSGFTGEAFDAGNAVVVATGAEYVEVHESAVATAQPNEQTVYIFNADLKAWMEDCEAGISSYGQDTCRSIWGTLIRCKGGDESFCGCGTFASPIRGTLIECEGGDNSFALGSMVDGRLERCRGDECGFGGTAETGHHNQGWIGPNAEIIECVVDNDTDSATTRSFGQGELNRATVQGLLMDCRLGTISANVAGTSIAQTVLNCSGQHIRCHPPVPTACTASVTISEFDSGQTFTNEGAAAGITYTLPAAKAGMKFRICRTDFDAGEDITVQPDGTDIIYRDKTDYRWTWDPPSIAGFGLTSTDKSVAGAAFGDFVRVSASYDVADLHVTSYVQASGTVSVVIGNLVGGAVDLGSGTWHIRVLHRALVSCGAGKYHRTQQDVDEYCELELECRKDGEWTVVREIGTWETEA